MGEKKTKKNLQHAHSRPCAHSCPRVHSRPHTCSHPHACSHSRPRDRSLHHCPCHCCRDTSGHPYHCRSSPQQKERRGLQWGRKEVHLSTLKSSCWGKNQPPGRFEG